MRKVKTVTEAMQSVHCALDEATTIINRLNYTGPRFRPLTQDDVLEELSELLSNVGAARDDLWRAKG